jgi:signal transduction protein with GAF and PtsI domain
LTPIGETTTCIIYKKEMATHQVQNKTHRTIMTTENQRELFRHHLSVGATSASLFMMKRHNDRGALGWETPSVNGDAPNLE